MLSPSRRGGARSWGPGARNWDANNQVNQPPVPSPQSPVPSSRNRPAWHSVRWRSRGRVDFPERRADVKQIVAVVKPFLVEKLLESLRRAPLEACSVREVKGYGRQKSYLDQYSDSEYSQAFLPKVEVTLWVEDARSEEIVRKIIEVTRTGRMGDGKIFVLPAVTPEQMK